MAQWKGFISSLRRMVGGGFQLNFAGGEPLARPETLELIKFACGLGFNTLLATNGFLIDEAMAQRICDSGATSVNISLDSLKQERHDYLRGVDGSHMMVMRAIELLSRRKRKIHIGICTVISAQNMDELGRIARWVQSNDKISGMGFQAVTQPFSTPEDRFWYLNKEFSSLWPADIAKAEAAIDELIELKEEGLEKLGNPLAQLNVYKAYFRDPNSFIKRERCHIDTQAINVTPLGEIRLCFYMEPAGNIKTDDIVEVWDSESARRIRERITCCKKNCQSMVNCNFDESQAYIS